MANPGRRTAILHPGWLATVHGLPGMTDAVASLVVVTANTPSISAQAGTGSMVQVKGSGRIRPVNPPALGRALGQMPTKFPRPS